MKGKRFSIICLITLLSAIPTITHAGTTGTLAGYVRDKETGEPLLGASVIIEGTTLGAMAGKEGFYIVNNIPVGTYTVRAEMMGYTTLKKINVVIVMDLRTTINFELSPTVIELGEAIEVVAERPLIQRDVTASIHFVDGKEITRLPVDTFQEAVLLQPGVVAEHIRGGRTTEVLYMVDGIPIQEVIHGGRGIALPNNSIIEMTVQTGGFNAEYGNAMSGVVNVVTKEGGSHHRLYYLNLGDFYHLLGKDSEKISNFDRYIRQELNLSGPLSTIGNYFISTDYTLTDTRYRETMRNFFDSPISRNINTNSKLTFRLSKNMKLMLQGLYSYWKWREYEHRWKLNLTGLPGRKKQSLRLNGRFTHTLSPTTFYTINLSRYNVLKQVLGKKTYKQPQLSDPRDPRSWIISGDKQWWQDSEEIIDIFKVDFVSQLTPNHQIKGGLELTYYDLYMNDVKYTQVPIDSARNIYSYTAFQNKYRYFPLAGAAYLQDKIEQEGLVANVGLRFDFLDPKATRPAIELPPVDVSEKYYRRLPQVKASIKTQLSPRVGIAFPITDKDVLHLNYGWFFQMPSFNFLYTSLDNDLTAYWPLVGNPDLKAERTIAYELSYKRILSETVAMSITAFNKDVINLTDTKTMALPDTTIQGSAERRGFAEYVNIAYGHTRGLEIVIEKRYSGLISGKFSYTYMKASGSSSSAGQGYNWMIWGILVPAREYPLSWDQRHTFILNLDLRKENNWGLNLLVRLNSPLPYTGLDSQHPNSHRMKWRNYIDLKFNKDIKLFGKRLAFYAEILNLTNRKNLLWVDANGVPGGHLGDPSAYDIGRRIRTGISLNLQ